MEKKMNKLKFQDTANIGDTIKALDFAMPNSFVIGKVIKKGNNTDYIYSDFVYQIVVEQDSEKSQWRVGETYFIPMEMTFDWDNRITKVAQ